MQSRVWSKMCCAPALPGPPSWIEHRLIWQSVNADAISIAILGQSFMNSFMKILRNNQSTKRKVSQMITTKAPWKSACIMSLRLSVGGDILGCVGMCMRGASKNWWEGKMEKDLSNRYVVLSEPRIVGAWEVAGKGNGLFVGLHKGVFEQSDKGERVPTLF